MKTLALLSSVCALGVAACAPPAPSQLESEDVTAIEESTTAFVEAVLAADWDAVAALYTEDAIVMPPNEAAVEGRPAIRDWFAAFSPMINLELEPMEIEGIGDLAYSRGTYLLELSMNDQAVTDRGKYVEIRREQEDGSWLIAVDLFNSDQPPAPPPAAPDTVAGDTAAAGATGGS